jgi:hypothetical protein
MREVHRPPTPALRSCYETVAYLQPGGNRQVPHDQAKNSRETCEVTLNNFGVVNSGVAHGHPNGNRMLANMDGTPTRNINLLCYIANE